MEKKVELMLKDFLKSKQDFTIEENFLELYENHTDIFLKIFAIFHQELNEHFNFINSKIDSNRHYNAEESRGLMSIISCLRKFLKNP